MHGNGAVRGPKRSLPRGGPSFAEGSPAWGAAVGARAARLLDCAPMQPGPPPPGMPGPAEGAEVGAPAKRRGIRAFFSRYGRMLWWLHSFYALGLGLPFIVAGVAYERMLGTVRFVREHQVWVTRIGGLMMIAVGLLLVTGWWGHLVTWLQIHLIGGFEVSV